MKAFLDKIGQLSSVRELMLLSLDGELLYAHPSGDRPGGPGLIDQWQQVVTGLELPETADFIYEKGRFFLVRLTVGSLVVAVHGDDHIKAIRDGCTAVQEKLKDGSIRRNVLLRMFSENSAQLRPAHIKMLQSVAGPEVVTVLAPILEKAGHSQSAGSRQLIDSACQVLGHCRTPEALGILRKYLNSFGSVAEQQEAVQSAKIAVAQLELDNLDAPTGSASELDILSPLSTAAPLPDQKDLSPADQKIRKLAEEGNKAEAVELIMAAIRKHAGQKDFTEAERYRQMLIVTDSMALREIISAAEIIADGKSSSISDTMMSTWDDLIQELSLEEFSALYFAARPKNTTLNQVLVEQGDFLSNLYFVNSGRVQLYTTKNGREMVFKTVEEGEIFGAESFFDISVWTVSAKSLGASLLILTWERLATLKNDYPALQNNLFEYCKRFQGNHSFFQKPSTSRRKYERKKLDGRATIEVLNDSGAPTGQVARGDLIDISQGGVAFMLRFNRKEYANELLGKRVKVQIRPDHASSTIDRIGLVKAVRCNDFVGNDYSVHLQFDEKIGVTEVSQAAARKSD